MYHLQFAMDRRIIRTCSTMYILISVSPGVDGGGWTTKESRGGETGRSSEEKGKTAIKMERLQ